MTHSILIAGATGHIGAPLVRELINHGLSFRVLVHSHAHDEEWRHGKVEPVLGDFSSPSSLETAFRGVERLFFLSPFVENMVAQAGNVIHAAQKVGVKSIVRLSVLGASEKGTTIARWHREVEKMVESSALKYTLLRPGCFMQNFLMLADSIRDQDTFYLPYGDAPASYIDARDIAAVAAVVLTSEGHDGKTYPLTGAEAPSCQQIAQLFSRTLDRAIKYVNATDEEAEHWFQEHGMPPWFIGALTELNQDIRAGRLKEISPMVEQLTKRKPKDFSQFIHDHQEAFALALVGAR